jgi:HEAT repeat protein
MFSFPAQVRVKPPDPPAELMAALKSKDSAARRRAADQLGAARARGGVRGLTTLTSDAEPSVREAAVFALGQIADPAVKGILIKLLSDKAAYVRASAAFALGMLADKSAVQALSDALEDSESSVRGAAAAALGLLHDEAAVDELIDLLNDDSFDVRYDAVWALGQIGDPDAAEHLRAALAASPARTPDQRLAESFREAVQNALDDIKAQTAASSEDKAARPRRTAAAGQQQSEQGLEQGSGQQQSHAGRGPAVKQSMLPAPTEDAIRANISGAVGLKVLVGTGGRAVRAYVTRRLGYGLDRRAVQAALEYGYDAGLRDGLVQTDWLSLLVRFPER